MSFRVNGVEVFGNGAALSKVAITAQRDGDNTDVTSADEMLIYDNETDGLMRVAVAEYQRAAGIVNDIDNNCYIGLNLGGFITDGVDNVFLGSSAGNNLNVDSSRNTIIGRLACGNFGGVIASNENTIIGFAAGLGLSGPGAFGNTLIGDRAGVAMGRGFSNVSIGRFAAGNQVDGNINTSVGNLAGIDLTLGSANVCLGANSGYGIGASNENIFIGFQAGGRVNDEAQRQYGDKNIIIGPSHASTYATDTETMSIGIENDYFIRGTRSGGPQGQVLTEVKNLNINGVSDLRTSDGIRVRAFTPYYFDNVTLSGGNDSIIFNLSNIINIAGGEAHVNITDSSGVQVSYGWSFFYNEVDGNGNSIILSNNLLAAAENQATVPFDEQGVATLPFLTSSVVRGGSQSIAANLQFAKSGPDLFLRLVLLNFSANTETFNVSVEFNGKIYPPVPPAS